MEKEKIASFIETNKDIWIHAARTIWENPELGHQEFKACELLTQLLKSHGFHVKTGTSGLPTAFQAIYSSTVPGPTIAYLAEYDALPEIGHACGHNLIGVMSVTAAIALKKAVDQFGGTVIVFGTPAEETSGGKVTMAEQGLFDAVDAALMVHPSQFYERSGVSMAMEAVQFDFIGKTAHAAARPQDGINALDAVIQTFNAINALRQHMTSDVRIHGIITHGGTAANVVPDHGQAQFYVRTRTKSTLGTMVEKVKDCARAAALATGTTLQISNYELGYDNLITNEALSEAFVQNLINLGVDPAQIHHGLDHGSIDIGNVSQRTAAIHPYIQIPNSPYGGHTIEFKDAAGSENGMQALLLGAKSLAWTGYDILSNPNLLLKIRKEFLATTTITKGEV
ncbi:M20 family metallopeptidase [Paenibacillus sp. MAH-36]|uniref:Peptidase M20 domain-containing protein 2 n=1 Tax=Paenibacillus violae TaxID=3077234 RepID=A0ABU3RKN1_9BACL|nr:M20 family metallopeptidase [Paenibacillus sp. PFR10]MDU0204857.1 M20 family metallopeptidase [Paenibacillus sp. PFR10]